MSLSMIESPMSDGLDWMTSEHSTGVSTTIWLDWSKGGQRNISKFFSTMAKKIFLWICTFQAILRPFHPYNFCFQNFEIF